MFSFLRRWRQPPPQDSWNASAYLRGSDLIIHAQNRTYNNYGCNSEPVVKVSVNLPRSELGTIIRSVLGASRWDAERPDLDGEDNPVLRTAGVKNWDKLERESRLASIGLRNEQITIGPSRAAMRGEGKGFIFLEGAVIRISKDCSDEELGNALMEALDRSIPWTLNR